MSKLLVVVLVSVVLSVFASACLPDSRCPDGGSWMSAGANNPNGICVTEFDEDGSPSAFYAASAPAEQQAQAASDAVVNNVSTTVQEVGKCYNRIGMATTCVAEQTK